MQQEQLSLFDTPELEILTKPTVKTEYGQLWQLGQHRLLVGNSRNPQDVARLFAGNKAVLCFTSPPYTDQRTYDGEPFNWTDLMCEVFDNIIANSLPDVHILVNLGLSHKNRAVNEYWNDWKQYCKSIGWPLFGLYIWDKGAALPGDMNGMGRLGASFEFIFHFTKQTKRPNKWIPTQQDYHISGGFRKKNGDVKPATNPENYHTGFKIPDNVIRINRQNGSTAPGHPAPFPVELPEFIYKTYSQPNDICYEPFNGSGSSIIAGERTKRIVYAMEKHPAYCDIAIERWQQVTKQKAVLLENNNAMELAS